MNSVDSSILAFSPGASISTILPVARPASWALDDLDGVR